MGQDARRGGQRLNIAGRDKEDGNGLKTKSRQDPRSSADKKDTRNIQSTMFSK